MSEQVSSWSFLKRHKAALVGFVVAAIAAAVWAVWVFWWFTGNSQSTGLVPSSLGDWSMGNLLDFIIYAVFWELLLVGIPVAVGGVAVWMWWRRLPSEERLGYYWGRQSRSARRSGGAGFLLFLAFALKVYLDGNWDIPISTYSLNYVVGSTITILAWVVAIFGIPAAILLAWLINREFRKVQV